ncbi:glycosyltransferase family 4 protein [Guptibacillus hwajinpoensis]|uniref:Glycosyltransferase involved in cell wall biosynthesis n=1 Tax=Guptibacillus hwajinpoensis TaxID=208199 RepID=A0ABU0K2R5_9BACL|nr:glycosyltransferase family 4 protein [Alkalihalobacillus hemicentroti]MDQ0482693.1 glycosyltransferase involved in cell wall biosynthesis [Alkalihalobacillus hemicentroti]
MRILLAYRSYLPHLGGVWTYIEQLRKGLEHKGHNVDVLAWHPSMRKYYLMRSEMSFETDQVKPLITNKVNAYYEQHFPQYDTWIRDLEINRYLFEAAAVHFNLSDYDVIHAQCVISARALSRVKPPETPLVTTIHSSLTNELFMRQGNNSKQLHKCFISSLEHLGPVSSDLCILPSHFLKNFTKTFDVPENKLKVVPYGIDIGNFLQRMNDHSNITATPNKMIIACPARLSFEKGHSDLLRALATLKDKNRNWVCWVIGDGEYKRELLRLTRKMSLQNHVLFLGKRDDVPALMKKADVIVLPSLLENLPFVVMEGQMSGTAVVASDAGGIPEMVKHGETGLLFATGSAQKLSENLLKVLENEALRKELAIKGKEWAIKQWPINQMINSTLIVYQQAKQNLLQNPVSTSYDIPDLKVVNILEKCHSLSN